MNAICKRELSQPVTPASESSRKASTRVIGNPAFDAGVVNECSQSTIRIRRYVEGFMDQEVIARSLANDLEIIHKGLLKAYLTIEGPRRLTGRLILVTRGEAGAAHSLGLVLELGMETALVVNHRGEQNMQRTTHLNEFSGTLSRTGDEHK